MNRATRVLVGLVIVGVLAVVIGRVISSVVPPPVVGLTADGRLHPCPDDDSCVSSLADDERHAIEPLPCAPGDLAAVVQRAERVLDRVTVEEIDGRYAHLTARSFTFGFVDDLELHGRGSAIQVRSAARLGGNDFGVNRDRVQSLHEAVDGTVCQ